MYKKQFMSVKIGDHTETDTHNFVFICCVLNSQNQKACSSHPVFMTKICKTKRLFSPFMKLLDTIWTLFIVFCLLNTISNKQ